MPPCLTQYYKECIKGKERNPGKGVAASPIEKGTFGSPLTTVANFTYLYIYWGSENIPPQLLFFKSWPMQDQIDNEKERNA